MKNIIWVFVMTLALGVVFYPMVGDAQMGPGYGMGPGMMGRGYGSGSGSGYGMGPGMMGPGYGSGYGSGYGMGPGMMGRGYGSGYGMGPGMRGPGYGGQYGPQYGPQYQQRQNPLDQDQAKQEVENYIGSLRNPNLKLGKIEEKGDNYQVDIETKDGSLVDKLLVDKYTGGMRSIY